ncbi:type III secretion system outer membrane ring subunit SctC [Rouxiella sp. WC2420]|uniref:Type III secretion system outer membrane ring subunit SctC n=1 Tax=Rouxiella sp. WC2420 TaxID=3234145 RepID=A0AB39VMA9_9GAMM
MNIKKNTLSNMFKIFVMIISIAAFSAESNSNDLEKNNSGYVANNESIRGLFEAISSKINKPVILSNLASRKKITGEFSLLQPQLQIESFCNRLGLIWYDNQSSIYIYDSSEMDTKIITMKNISYPYFIHYLKSSDLFDKRFPIRGEEGSQTFFISGPPVYVETISGLATTLNQQHVSSNIGDSVSTFYLSNTFSEDRTYNFQDKPIVVPGVATVLTQLFSGTNLISQKKRDILAGNSAARLGTKQELSDIIDDEPDESFTEIKGVTGNQSVVQIISNPGNNSLLIKGSDEQINNAKNIIAALDQPRRHIELSVWIVDLQKSALEQLGVNFKGGFNIGQRLGFSLNGGRSGAVSGGNISSTLDGGEFIAEIIALSKDKLANIISRPVILTQENIPAIFDNSHSIYTRLLGEHNVELQKITFGTSVSVLPRFTRNDEIEMMLNVEDGNEIVSGGGNESALSPLPQVGRTNISTIARVPKGKSLLIGGYTRDEQQNEYATIPFLGSLPVVGALFRYQVTQKNETVRVFLIQPREILASNMAEENTLPMVLFTATPLRDWKQNLEMSMF